MWQTSGGWGRIDRADAVDAMFAYADSGLSTFDMADHCPYPSSSLDSSLLSSPLNFCTVSLENSCDNLP
jgi:hypothetical protein